VHILTDNSKGFAGAFDAVFDNAGKFKCKIHKGNNLIKKGTRGDKAVYDKALYAKSTEELENAKSQYLAKGAAYMAKTPDDQLYLFTSGPRNCGKTSSQVSESLNAANLQMRGAHISMGLLQFADQELTRIFNHKDVADKHNNNLPPFALTMLRDMEKEAVTRHRSVDAKGPRWAIVHSSTGGMVSYNVHGEVNEPLRCSCSKSKVETYLCEHEREAARALKIPMAKLFEEKDRTATWKDQYSVVDKDLYVSTNEVFREYLGNHLLPVVFKKPAGRPKKNKRKKSALEIALAKKVHA
jgi:hypothetical protein